MNLDEVYTRLYNDEKFKFREKSVIKFNYPKCNN